MHFFPAFQRQNIYSLLLILITAILTTSGCTSYRAIYGISLAHVERSPYANIHHGDYKLTSIMENGLIKYQFKDDVIDIIWHPTASRFNFKLIIDTKSAVKLLWDKAVYIDENKILKRIIHPGVNYFRPEVNYFREDEYPWVIRQRVTIEDYVVPADNLRNQPGSWTYGLEYELFPNLDTFVKYGTRSAIMEYKGKEVMVLLPLEVNNIENTYIFIFRVDDIIIRKRIKYPFSDPDSSMLDH